MNPDGFDGKKDEESAGLEASPEFWRMIEGRRQRPTVRLEDVEAELLADDERLASGESRIETEDELYERAKKLFDPQEIERRMATEKDQGYAFEQVMEHLRSMEAEERKREQ